MPRGRKPKYKGRSRKFNTKEEVERQMKDDLWNLDKLHNEDEISDSDKENEYEDEEGLSLSLCSETVKQLNKKKNGILPDCDATEAAASGFITQNCRSRNKTLKMQEYEELLKSQKNGEEFIGKENKEERKDIPVFCYCGKPDDGDLMVFCNGCEEWFHGRCVGILSKKDSKKIGEYFCDTRMKAALDVSQEIFDTEVLNEEELLHTNDESENEARIEKQQILIEEKNDVIIRLKNENKMLIRETKETKDKINEAAVSRRKIFMENERLLKQKESRIRKLENDIKYMKDTISKQKYEELQKKEKLLQQKVTTFQKHEETFRRTIDVQRNMIEAKQKLDLAKNKEIDDLSRCNASLKKVLEENKVEIDELNKENYNLKNINDFWKEHGFNNVDEYIYTDDSFETILENKCDEEENTFINIDEDSSNLIISKINIKECHQINSRTEMESKCKKLDSKVIKLQKELKIENEKVSKLNVQLMKLKEDYEELVAEKNILVEENRLNAENIEMQKSLNEHYKYQVNDKIESVNIGVGMEYTSGEDKTCNLCDSVEGCNFGEKCKSAYLMKVDVPIESDGDSLGVNERNKKQDHTQRKVCHFYNSEKGCKFGVHCRYDHKDKESTQGKILTDNAPNVQSTNKYTNGRYKKKKLCRWFNRKEGCRNGNSCNFTHEIMKKEVKEAKTITKKITNTNNDQIEKNEQNKMISNNKDKLQKNEQLRVAAMKVNNNDQLNKNEQQRLHFLEESVAQICQTNKLILMSLVSHGLIQQQKC